MLPFLNTDGLLSIDAATLSTSEVDKLIQQLALIRSRMSPAIALEIDQAPDDNITSVTEPPLAISKTEEGDISIFFRHQGFGWFAFIFPTQQAAFLHAALGKRLVGVEVDVINEKGPTRNEKKH
jgi:hypothetical protein